MIHLQKILFIGLFLANLGWLRAETISIVIPSNAAPRVAFAAVVSQRRATSADSRSSQKASRMTFACIGFCMRRSTAWTISE